MGHRLLYSAYWSVSELIHLFGSLWLYFHTRWGGICLTLGLNQATCAGAWSCHPRCQRHGICWSRGNICCDLALTLLCGDTSLVQLYDWRLIALKLISLHVGGLWLWWCEWGIRLPKHHICANFSRLYNAASSFLLLWPWSCKVLRD